MQHVSSVVAAGGLQSTGSVVAVHGLSCSVIMWDLPRSGADPCPLHCKVDSQPLEHQGTPPPIILNWISSHCLAHKLIFLELHLAVSLTHVPCTSHARNVNVSDTAHIIIVRVRRLSSWAVVDSFSWQSLFNYLEFLIFTTFIYLKLYFSKLWD